MPAASTVSGACISGSIARRWDGTRRAPGGGVTTSTRLAEARHGHADARRLDDVDDVDAGARPIVAGHGGGVHGDVDRDDGSDDAAVVRPYALALPAVARGN